MIYDLSKVPKDVICVTTDKDWTVKGFEGKPYKLQIGFKSNYPYFILKGLKPFSGDWCESIEFRPKGVFEEWRKEYE